MNDLKPCWLSKVGSNPSLLIENYTQLPHLAPIRSTLRPRLVTSEQKKLIKEKVESRIAQRSKFWINSHIKAKLQRDS